MAQSNTKNLAVRNKFSDVENTLPPVAELVGDQETIFRYIDLDGQQQVLNFGENTKYDQMPLPMPVDREGYCSVEATPRYWATGLGDWQNVKEAMQRFLSPPENQTRPLRLMDFGCATGRFLRHPWVDRQAMNLDLWGCDFSPENVEWSRRYLDRDIKIVLNHSMPHLPFPDNYFDVLTAFSVMTHIDMFEETWLLELRRITRDDGLLYLTIQNEASWAAVPERPSYLQHIKNANKIPGNLKITEELFDAPMQHDRIALRMSPDDVYNCNVWHSNKYVNDSWGRFFEVLHIADNGHNSYQSPVILRPEAGGLPNVDPRLPR